MIEQNIKSTSDRKTRAYDSQRNTYGLLPGRDRWHNQILGTCPGATTGEGGCWTIRKGVKCPTCYVTRTMSAYKGVYPVLMDNTILLRNCIMKQDGMWMFLRKEFKRFEDAELKRKAEGKPYSMNYRLHWSGDVFDETYAKALQLAVSEFPNINFWCYTRSMFAVPILSNIPNLILYISLDPQNFDEGLSTYVDNKEQSPNLRLCYMSPVNDFKQRLEAYMPKFVGQNMVRKMLGSKLKNAKLLAINMTACPADSGKMDLDGCCHKCTQCMGAVERHVWFEA